MILGHDQPFFKGQKETPGRQLHIPDLLTHVTVELAGGGGGRAGKTEKDLDVMLADER